MVCDKGKFVVGRGGRTEEEEEEEEEEDRDTESKNKNPTQSCGELETFTWQAGKQIKQIAVPEQESNITPQNAQFSGLTAV